MSKPLPEDAPAYRVSQREARRLPSRVVPTLTQISVVDDPQHRRHTAKQCAPLAADRYYQDQRGRRFRYMSDGSLRRVKETT